MVRHHLVTRPPWPGRVAVAAVAAVVVAAVVVVVVVVAVAIAVAAVARACGWYLDPTQWAGSDF